MPGRTRRSGMASARTGLQILGKWAKTNLCRRDASGHRHR